MGFKNFFMAFHSILSFYVTTFYAHNNNDQFFLRIIQLVIEPLFLKCEYFSCFSGIPLYHAFDRSQRWIRMVEDDLVYVYREGMNEKNSNLVHKKEQKTVLRIVPLKNIIDRKFQLCKYQISPCLDEYMHLKTQYSDVIIDMSQYQSKTFYCRSVWF